jgi:hypothetical protein
MSKYVRLKIHPTSRSAHLFERAIAVISLNTGNAELVQFEHQSCFTRTGGARQNNNCGPHY